VNGHLLKTLCTDGTIPVIASVAQNKSGGKLNINADSAAGKVAATLQADDPASWVSSLDEGQIKDMIDAGIIGDAMLPKVEACVTALDGGVSKAHIIDGRIEHSLLLEIYTDKGVGTQIIKNLEGKGT
jgi:acetylglutamate kinase